MKFSGLLIAVVALVIGASATPAQLADCHTYGFLNEYPFAVPAQALSFTIPAPGVTVESVVVPPNMTTGEYRPCSLVAPRYLVTCNGTATSTQVDIVFTDFIGVGQWVSVTVRSPGPVPPGGTFWTTDQGAQVPAPFEPLEDIVINEVSAGASDWIEIMNVGAVPVDITDWRIEFRRRDAGTNAQIFFFDPSVPLTMLTPGELVVVHDGLPSIPGGAVGIDVNAFPGSFQGNGAPGNIVWSCSGEGSAYLLRPSNITNLAPVDGLVFGYFREANASLLNAFAPAPDTLQSYCDNGSGAVNEHHSLYRVDNCSRFEADAFGNQWLPDHVMGTGTTGAPVSPVTLGAPNPGQCLYGGPRTVTMSISRCPVTITVDGATMGSPVFLFASDILGPTQGGGALLGLQPSPLLFGVLGGPLPGTASVPSTCGLGGSFVLPLGFLPPLCLEFSAVAFANALGGPYPVLSNVVRFH